LQDSELIAAALRGERTAERALYDAHVDRVYRLAYRMSGDATLAEDFTQETFVRAFGYLPGFRGQAAFSTWLHAIASSVVLNGLRKLKSRRHWAMEPAEHWDSVVDQSAPDRELRLSLLAAVDRLPDELRMVFLMHEADGYTHTEIGEILGIPEGTSKARLHRARGELRERLGELDPGRGRRAAGKEGA